MKGIDYFNRGHWLTGIQERLSLRTRRKMYELWQVNSPVRILDVGTTPDIERLDSNCFLKWLQDDGHSVSVVSPEDVSELQNIFPAIKVFPKIVGHSIPMGDQSFDWIFSSAVLEHVGSAADQEHFLRECSRVGNAIFLTTPNRWHWLEFHTKLPFLHWLPKALHRRILSLLGMKFWAQEKNLNLLSKMELSRIASATLGEQFQFTVNSVWALGMPSNLVLIARRKV